MLNRRTMFATGLTLAAASGARAQPQTSAWPTRPLRWIMPDTPGSGNDIIGRMVSPLLEGPLGQPIVIDTRAGAGGRIGVEAAFRAAPDGYTFLVGNAGANGINAAIYRDLPYDLTNAFQPISLMVLGPNVLVVNPRVFAARNLRDLIVELRAR
ncbi:MAG: tripartite tricarboxylate transporter substrate binding protein, partial [Actinobacteria bacterium]|nr:tripartite tricarboxylate transporter substrate binding protein [Actinomycetota bacterium]